MASLTSVAERTTPAPVAPPGPESCAGPIEVRFLRHDDIERLMVLEHRKWTPEQAAGPEDMARRIEAYPGFCFGAFSSQTGEALASVFIKPIADERLRTANTWADCASVELPPRTRTQKLFGISLTSIDQNAISAILGFFWPIALKGGFREIFLGSPVPGLRAWLRRNADRPVEEYVYAKHKDRPLDPQLFYYHEKGFTSIEACKPDYFPHERSLNYGAVLRAKIPLSAAAPLWQIMPSSWLRSATRLLARHVG